MFQTDNVTVEEKETYTSLVLHEPRGRLQMVCDLLNALRWLQQNACQPWLVITSSHPKYFHLGGDLAFFADCVGQRSEGLMSYAQACIDIVWMLHTGLSQGICTTSLVQGAALGGGFELALACDIIVATPNAIFGLPEINYGLFPGMGAYSLLTRKVGPREARHLCETDERFSGQDLFGGVVDYLIGPSVSIANMLETFKTSRFALQACRFVDPLLYSELIRIMYLWLDNVEQLSERDVSRLRRVAGVQNREVA